MVETVTEDNQKRDYSNMVKEIRSSTKDVNSKAQDSATTDIRSELKSKKSVAEFDALNAIINDAKEKVKDTRETTQHSDKRMVREIITRLDELLSLLKRTELERKR